MVSAEMSLKISRILHAGYIFELGDVRIIFDPLFENPFSRNCYAFPDVLFDAPEIRKEKFSAVFISHYHDDHLSFESLNLISKETPIYIYCIFDEIFEWVKALGFINVFSVKLGQSIEFGQCKVTVWPALDVEVDSIYQIQANGLNILNVVDSWIDYETLDRLVEAGPWDLILWPFQTMRELEVLAPMRFAASDPEIPIEWIEQIQKLKPRHLIASSCQFQFEKWSWYNHAFFPISYKLFKEELSRYVPLTNFINLSPGTSIKLNAECLSQDSPIPWLKPIGSQAVDYHYEKNGNIPSTAKISSYFPELNPEQKARIDKFCLSELSGKFNSFSSSVFNSFEKPFLWSLRLFDSCGKFQTYSYRFFKDRLDPVSDPYVKTDWVTEVIGFKLYSALTTGESLTSMYLRITMENEFQEIDLMEDPLIRCLYEGKFGGYQKHQLQRLISTYIGSID